MMRTVGPRRSAMGYVDAQENLRSGDVMELWVKESEQEDQGSSAQPGGDARQLQQQRYRGKLILAEG